MITPEKLILIDMLIEQIISITARIRKVKLMNAEEVERNLELENERTRNLKNLLEADLKETT